MNSLSHGNLEKASQKDGKFRIQGIMSAPVVDLEGEMIAREAYDGIIRKIEEKASRKDFLPIVIEHRRHEPLPVGYVEKAYETDQGLAFEGVIANGPAGSLQNTIQELVQQNVLRHVSIGGDVAGESGSSEMVFDPAAKKYVRRIKNAVVRELSLTGLPVNEEATFSLAKSLHTPKEDIGKLMKKFDKAYMKEALQKSLAKAIDNSDLGAVEEALKNLATVLQEQFGLDINVDNLTGGAGATPEAGAEAPKTGAEIATAVPETKPENIAEPKPMGEEKPVVEEKPVTEEKPVEEKPAPEVPVPTPAPTPAPEKPVEEAVVPVEEKPAEVPAAEPVTEEATEAPVAEGEAPLGESELAEEKLDTIISLLQKLLGEEEEEEATEKKEAPMTENKSEGEQKMTNEKEVVKSLDSETKGGDETMEKRLICKACGEDFAYEEDEIEKSFTFCPKCGKPLSKAIVDTKLNKVYHIESVADAEAVDNASDMAVETAKGHAVKDSSLTGDTGNVGGIEPTVDMAVETAEGKDLKESAFKNQYVAKSEEKTEIEKNLVSEQIREKKQGNQLKSDFNESSPYLDENAKNVKPAVDTKIKENQFKRDGVKTTYSEINVAKKVEKSMEERINSLEKALISEDSGRKGMFSPQQKMEKSINKELGENEVFLRAIFPKK